MIKTTCDKCGGRYRDIELNVSSGKMICDRCYRRAKDEASAAGHNVDDSGFDVIGFAFGLSTGVPISPTRGISGGSILGSMLHEEPKPAATYEPPSAPSPAYEPPAPPPSYATEPPTSSSYDSGSSSSFDSGGSSE